MGKDYDNEITPQNTRWLKQKKCLYASVAAVFALTSGLVALLCPEDRALGLIGVILAVLQTSTQMMTWRKERWTWGYIVLRCLVFFAFAVFLILGSGLYWCLALWAAAIAACVVLAIYDNREKRKRK